MELTFHPCWTCVVLLEEAHWFAEHNCCTYNRSDFMILTWGAGGPGQRWIVLYDQSASYMLTIQPDETHLGCFSERWELQMLIGLRLPHPAPKEEDVLLRIVFTYNLSNPRKEVAASWSQRSVSRVLCARLKLMMSTLHVYMHTHAQRNTHTHTRGTSKCRRQWHKPSAAVFRLRWALLMQRVLYNGAHFHFHPSTAAPPFCSSHLHHSLCTHDM